jgi:hypothetical protein
MIYEIMMRLARFLVTSRTSVGIGGPVTFLVFSVTTGFADEWPPSLDQKNPTTKSLDGRTIERYIHGRRESWGYAATAHDEWSYPAPQETGAAQQNHNSFYVVAPKHPRENAPLYVVLHSANRTAYDYLGFALLDRKIDEEDDPSTAMTNVPDGFYGLYLNSTNDEWWGWSQARQSTTRQVNIPPPAELRVLDTVEWVVRHCKIDRNRIYLSGVSMGGNGALGIGMPHGDIFAALRVTVPAGTGFAAYRLGGIAPSPAVDAPSAERQAWIRRASGEGMPDPPVVVDFSSPLDAWSMTQPALVQAAQAGHLPLILSWGPFGHTIFSSRIAKSPLCEIALEYPWLEIHRNEAYPVFTHASSDQRSPWLNAPADFDDDGQTNAYFRWKNEQDMPSRFTMQLWIVHPAVKNSPAAMPDTATTDVTLRRLQKFKVKPGGSYTWQVIQGGHLVRSGRVQPDVANLLTITDVLISPTPLEITLLAP